MRPLTEVFLLGTYGSTGTPAITLSGSIIINTDIDAFVNDLQYTRATAAHEFFHTIQWSFMTRGGICMWFGSDEFGIPEAWFLYEDLRWWMEATAQWAQHQVYSGPPLFEDKTYFQPIGEYLGMPWQHMDTRPMDGNNSLAYSILFPTYLVEHLPLGADFIKSTWVSYAATFTGCGPMMPALQNALAEQNTSMEQVFSPYAEANYSLAYQAEGDFRTLPGIGAVGRPEHGTERLNEGTLVVAGPPPGLAGSTVEHLASAYIEFNRELNNTTGRGLAIDLTVHAINPSVDPLVKILAVTKYDATVPPTMLATNVGAPVQVITNGNDKTYTYRSFIPNFDNPQLKWVTVMIANPQTSGASLTYNYTARVLPPTVIYAGDRFKGYVSTNGGGTWTSYTFPNNPSVQTVAAVPNAQGQIGYMATNNLKLWKTADTGITFTQTFDFAPKVQGVITNTHFSLIQIDPTTPETVYVGLRGKTDPFWGPEIGALFKSTDGGQTFGADLLADCHQNHNPNDWQDCAITSLAIDPNDPNVLWIGQNGWNATDQTLMRSSDGGQTWESKLNGTIATFARVSIMPTDSNVVWVLLQKQLDGQWVYRTADGGATWTLSKLDNTLNPTDRALQANPFLPLAAWGSGGEEGLKQSSNGSVTWEPSGGVRFHALVALEPNVLYGAASWPLNAGSIQVSVDGGASWSYIGDPAMIGVGDGYNEQPLSIVSQ